MSRYGGLDLFGATWRFTDLPSRTSLAGIHKDINPPIPFIDGFFSELDKLLVISDAQKLPVRFHAEDSVLQQRFLRLHSTFKSLAERLDAFGISHPYGTPPVVRRLLAFLLSGPSKSKGSDRTDVAIEAPLAACLQNVVDNSIIPPAQILAVCGSAASPELTLVDLQAFGSTLQMGVGFSHEWMYHEGWQDEEALVSAISRRVTNAAAFHDCHVCVTSLRLEEAGRQLAKALRIPDRRVHQSETAISVGAAMYAAFQHEGHLGDTKFTQISTIHVCPRPIGVLGTIRVAKQPIWAWRQLYAAGERLDGQPRAVHFSSSDGLPDCIVLAERVVDALDEQRWIFAPASRSFASGQERLRIFSSARAKSASFAAAERPQQLVIGLSNRSGVNRWTDQEVSIDLER